jgi:small subunit ribosomal protein S17
MIIKKGTVTKISGDKTIKVEVREYRTHPKYKKRYLVTKNFLAHDEDNTAKVDDVVTIRQCRPLSKNKSWTLSKEAK